MRVIRKNSGLTHYEVGFGGEKMTRDHFDQDNFYPLDGLTHYEVGFGGQKMTRDHFDQDNFYPVEGSSNAGGLFSNFKKNQAIRQKRRNDTAASRNDARQGRTAAKNTQAQAQADATKALSNQTDDGSAAALAALSTPGAAAKAKKSGMSTGAKIGIASAVVIVLGVAGFFVYKHFKKKK